VSFSLFWGVLDFVTVYFSTLAFRMFQFGFLWYHNFLKKKKKAKKRKENQVATVRDKMQGCPANIEVLFVTIFKILFTGHLPWPCIFPKLYQLFFKMQRSKF